MAVENIDALSDEVIERRALMALESDDANRRLPTDNDPLTRADYRAAYNLLVGANVTDRRGLSHRQFLREGTEGEICARHAMGRLLRRLARSRLDAEMTSILVLLAGHFDGKIGYGTNVGLHKSKAPIMELAAERRLKFEDHLFSDIRHRRMSRVQMLWDGLRTRSVQAKIAIKAVCGWAAAEGGGVEAWVREVWLNVRSAFQRLA